jgi:hypothetical protein
MRRLRRPEVNNPRASTVPTAENDMPTTMMELTEQELALVSAVRNARAACAALAASSAPGFKTPDGSKRGLFAARQHHALRGFRREAELALARLVEGT